MVTTHQKIMAIAEDLVNHKFGRNGYPVKPYNRTVIVPYSLKDIQSCLVAKYDKEVEGKLYAPSQIRKATQFFDELVNRGLATIKNPRMVPSKSNHAQRHENYKPDKPALLYLNLVRILAYLESEGTEGTEVEYLRCLIDRAKNNHEIDENELSKAYLERLYDSDLRQEDFIRVVRLINRFDGSTVKEYLPVLVKFILSSGIDRKTLMDTVITVDVGDSEPRKETPEPETEGVQNVPIEASEGIESSKTYLDTSEDIRPSEKHEDENIDLEVMRVMGTKPSVKKEDLEQDDSRVSEDVNPIPEYTIVSDHRFSMDNGRFYHKIEFYDKFPNGKFKQGRAIYPSKDSDEPVEIHIQTDCNNTSKFEIIWNSSEN